MKHIFAVIFFVFTSLIWDFSSTNAAGIRNVDDGWLLPAREMVGLLKSNKINGMYAQHIPGIWATAGSMQLFAMPQLPVKSIGGGIRLGTLGASWVLGFSWERTGQDNFLADYQIVEMQWEKKWMVAINLERKTMVLGDAPASSWLGVGFICSSPPIKTGDFIFRSELCVPVWASGDWREYDGRQIRAKALAFHGNLALVGAFEKKAFQGWAFGLELTLALDSRLGISVRSDPDTGSFGPGTMWMLQRMLFKTSHIVHPELGVTHRVAVTVGSLGSLPW